MNNFELPTLIMSSVAILISFASLWTNYSFKNKENTLYLKRRKSELLRNSKNYLSELEIFYASLILYRLDDFNNEIRKVLSNSKIQTKESINIVVKLLVKIENIDYKNENQLDHFYEKIQLQKERFYGIRTMIADGLKRTEMKNK